MKKALLAALMMATTIGASEITNKTMCQSIAMGFGNFYEMTKKNIEPREFCKKIVREKSANEDICTFDELTEGCINQIASKQKR